jgi:hypothetical protein
MANRTTSVGLKLENGQFKAEIDITETKVEGLDKTVEKLDRDITKIPADAAKAGAAMKLLGGDAEGVGKKLNDLGPGATNSLELIDKKLEETRGEIKKFADDFNKTGSGASLTGLLGAQSTEKDLEQLRTGLTKALGSAEKDVAQLKVNLTKSVGDAGKDGGEIFRGSLLKTLKGLPPEVQGYLVTAVAVAAPVIGSAVGGALLAGVAAAGIGIGIAGQIHNPAVVSAINGLKSNLSNGLHDVTSAFAPELVSAAGIIEASFARLKPGLKSTFDQLAPSLGHLVDGVTMLAEKAAPGFEKAMLAGGKVLDSISKKDLPNLGSALGNSLALIGENSKGAADGLHQVIGGADALITTTGVLIHQLENVDQDLQKITGGHLDWLLFGSLSGMMRANAEQTQFFDKAVGSLVEGSLGHGLLDAIGRLGGVSGATNDLVAKATAAAAATRGTGAAFGYTNGPLGTTTGLVGKLNKELAAAATNFDKVFGISMSVDQAQLGLQQSILGLSDSIKQNGKHWDITTQAGQANRAAVIQQEQAILALRDANVAAGMSAADADAQYAAQQAALRKTLIAAGLTTAQVDAMIGVFEKVPTKAETTISTPGLNSASSGVAGYNGQVGSIPEHVNTYVNTPGLGSASVEADLYRGKLYAIPANIRTTINIGVTGSGAKFVDNGGAVRISGSGQVARRWGGITEHAATGLLRDAAVYSPDGPARYAFAEPATGGEAFIPKNGDRARSKAILDQAARWYGGRFINGGMATPSAAPAVNVAPPNVRVYIGNEEITGRVQVMIDQHDQRTGAAVSGGVRY